MIIGNGNNFRDMLMKTPGTCPNCNASLTVGEAAQLAKSHNIQDNVVMCDKCHRVFEVNLAPGRMTLTSDVTAKYPQIKAKKPGELFGKLFGK